MFGSSSEAAQISRHLIILSPAKSNRSLSFRRSHLFQSTMIKPRFHSLLAVVVAILMVFSISAESNLRQRQLPGKGSVCVAEDTEAGCHLATDALESGCCRWGSNNKCRYAPDNICANLYTCPDTTGLIGICVELCSGDDDCPGIEKCCSNGCGHVCTIPVIA